MPENYITIPVKEGSIHISEEVIGTIAGTAAIEVEGVAGLAAVSGTELSDLIGKKSVSRGIRVSFEEDRILIDLSISVCFGVNITAVGTEVQKAVAQAVEAMTGLAAGVNVGIAAVSFDR